MLKDRIIHFEKEVRIVTESTKINSEKADFFLKPDTSELDRLYAQGKVTVNHEQKRGSGTTATFYAKDHKLVLEGAPKLSETGKADIVGRMLTLFLTDDRILIDGQEDGRATTTLQMTGDYSPSSTSAKDKDESGSDKKKDTLDAGSKKKNLKSENLTKSYKGRVVVRSVSFHVEQGEVVGLLGPNGAGKTTTFYMVVGLTPPESGSVFLDSQEITDLPMYLRARQGLSYLPQEPSVFRKLTVSENIMAILEMLNFNGVEKRQRMRDLMAELGLEHVANSKAYTLSGGERRRVEIARALATSPSFMLLDEPFAGIDPIAVADIQSIISKLRNSGIGILITDHNVRETLKITDRAYIINNGEIFRSGSPVELSSDPEVKKVYLGETFKLD